MSIPLLFLSDAPSAMTGLGRITRDLASLVSQMPEYRVGCLGKGGAGSRKLPFMQYSIGLDRQWGEAVIEQVWQDFSGGQRGVIFSIWDASRLLWFAQPSYAGDPQLERFLSSHHFSRWGYFPVDSMGIGGRLTAMSRDTMLGYDRLLAYTKWAESIVRGTLGDDESTRRRLDWIPHGIDFSTFQPRDKVESRKMLSPMFHDGDFLIGIVGTNQARKDWGLALTTVALLRQQVKRVRCWIHTDLPQRYWSIPALLTDLNLTDVTYVTYQMTDTQLSYGYSACDITLAPGLGEGFGYPIAESMACGVPVIHGNYAGGAEIAPSEMLVEPSAMRLDTLHNCLRPVFEPDAWAAKVMEVKRDPKWSIDTCRGHVSHLDWLNLWPGAWEPWWKEGVNLV